MEFGQLSTANKLFILLLVFQIIFALLTTIGAFTLGILEADPFAIALLLTILIGSVIAFWAIFNNKPPFHHMIYPASIANLVLSIFASSIQTINLANAVLLLYFHIRDPVPVDPAEYHQKVIKKRQQTKEKRVRPRKK